MWRWPQVPWSAPVLSFSPQSGTGWFRGGPYRNPRGWLAPLSLQPRVAAATEQREWHGARIGPRRDPRARCEAAPTARSRGGARSVSGSSQASMSSGLLVVFGLETEQMRPRKGRNISNLFFSPLPLLFLSLSLSPLASCLPRTKS